MDRINFFRTIGDNGNLRPEDMILVYFDQIMFLYNLYIPTCQILGVIHNQDSISFKIKYPCIVKGTDISAMISQINNQVINIYETPYGINVIEEQPDTELFTFTTISR